MRWRVNLHGKPVGVDQPANIASVDTRACASSLCATSRREIAGRRSVAVQCTSGRRRGHMGNLTGSACSKTLRLNRMRLKTTDPTHLSVSRVWPRLPITRRNS